MIYKILLFLEALSSIADKIFRFFFFNEKKYYKSRYEGLCGSLQKVHGELFDVQQELKKKQVILSNLRELLGGTKGGRIKMDKTKLGENVLVLDWGKNGDLYVEVFPYERSTRRAAYIMATIRKGDRIFIHDFQSSIVNEGYGTVAMDTLIEIAIKNEVPVVMGSISEVDKGHWDRLEHFYAKMGFDVNFKNKSLVRNMDLADNQNLLPMLQ